MRCCQCPCLSIGYALYSARISHGEQECKSIFTDSGCCLIITQQEPVQEPFRRSLASAVQWYDVLQVQVERQVEASLQICRDRIKAFKDARSAPLTPHIPTSVVTPACSSATPITPSSSWSSFDAPFKGTLVASTPGLISPSETLLIPTSCAQILVQ